MRLKAVVIILRKDHVFHTGEAIIYRTFRSSKKFWVVRRINLPSAVTAYHSQNSLIYHGYYQFSGFPVSQVPAYYRRDEPIDGYPVAVILEPSQADLDFGYPILFLSEDEVELIKEAFDKSDKLTEKVLGRGWGGKRPYQKLHHFVQW
jgi:hypothetical protein